MNPAAAISPHLSAFYNSINLSSSPAKTETLPTAMPAPASMPMQTRLYNLKITKLNAELVEIESLLKSHVSQTHVVELLENKKELIRVLISQLKNNDSPSSITHTELLLRQSSTHVKDTIENRSEIHLPVTVNFLPAASQSTAKQVFDTSLNLDFSTLDTHALFQERPLKLDTHALFQERSVNDNFSDKKKLELFHTSPPLSNNLGDIINSSPSAPWGGSINQLIKPKNSIWKVVAILAGIIAAAALTISALAYSSVILIPLAALKISLEVGFASSCLMGFSIYKHIQYLKTLTKNYYVSPSI